MGDDPGKTIGTDAGLDFIRARAKEIVRVVEAYHYNGVMCRREVGLVVGCAEAIATVARSVEEKTD